MFRKFLLAMIVASVSCEVFAGGDVLKIGLSNEEMASIVDQEKIVQLLKRNDFVTACKEIHEAVRNHNEILPDQKYEAERIGDNLLCLSAFLGLVDVVKFLIAKGVVADSCAYFGTTPLMYAIARKNVEMAQILLAYGADIHAVNRYGESVQDFLRAFPSERMQILCVMYGDDVQKT